MRKWRVLALLVCLLFVLTARLLVFRDTEPSEFGHPLSYWVELLESGPSVESFLPVKDGGYHDATNAIVRVGTNALPLLTKWIRYEESPWRTKISHLAQKVPVELVKAYAESLIRTPRAEVLANGAQKAFGVLGDVGAPAVPELAGMVNDREAPDVARRAANALLSMGTNGLPVVLGVLRDRGHPCRRSCIDGLFRIPGVSKVASEVVPVVAQCVNDTTDPQIARPAVMLLGDLKTEPASSVPALVAGLSSTDSFVRSACAEALMRFGNEAVVAIPALINALNDGSSSVRVSAGCALRQIAPEQFGNLEVEGNER